MNSKSTTYTTLAVAGYLALAVTFFFVRGWFVAVPTLFAAVMAAINCRKGGNAIPLALLFSAAGDYAGSTGDFIMQVGFFAVAHICYICDFAPHRVAQRPRMIGATALAAITILYLGFVLSHIAEQIEFGVGYNIPFVSKSKRRDSKDVIFHNREGWWNEYK